MINSLTLVAVCQSAHHIIIIIIFIHTRSTIEHIKYIHTEVS